MHRMTLTAALAFGAWASYCGGGTDNFGEISFEKLCKEQDKCDPDLLEDLGCNSELPPETGNLGDCDYDPKAAKDCLKADWPCTAGVVELAPVCDDVYVCADTGGP